MLLQVVCNRPTHLCVAHLNCTKKVHSFFFGVVRLEGVWRGGGVHVSGGRGLHGVSEGAG